MTRTLLEHLAAFIFPILLHDVAVVVVQSAWMSVSERRRNQYANENREHRLPELAQWTLRPFLDCAYNQNWNWRQPQYTRITEAADIRPGRRPISIDDALAVIVLMNNVSLHD